MPSGNVPLHEAVNYSGVQDLGVGLVETIVDNTNLINRLNWISFEGEALRAEWEGDLPNVQFRNVNEGYTADWASDTEHFFGVAILGGETKVDVFLERVVASRMSIMTRQLQKKAKANSRRFDYEAIHGTGSVASKGFMGMRQLIRNGFGQLSGSTTGAQLTLLEIDESIDLFKDQGDPSEMWLNRTMRRYITHLARTAHDGFSLIDVGTDEFGKRVTSYAGIPMVTLGQGMDSSGNQVDLLPFTLNPSGDAGGDTTSIFLVKHGEENLSGIAGKGGSFQAHVWGELESGPYTQARFEWYPGICIAGPYSVVEIEGILTPSFA